MYEWLVDIKDKISIFTINTQNKEKNKECSEWIKILHKKKQNQLMEWVYILLGC